MRLKDIMTERVERISVTESPARARELMRAKRIHHLVVVEDHQIAGLLTAESLHDAEANGAETIEPLMIRRIVTAPPDLTVRKAANLLRGSSVGAVPVVQRGRLIGIVTVSDLLELIGRGGERPIEKGKRWTLRHRGIRPSASRPPAPRRGA
jgi:CBS domain-containing protein